MKMIPVEIDEIAGGKTQCKYSRVNLFSQTKIVDKCPEEGRQIKVFGSGGIAPVQLQDILDNFIKPLGIVGDDAHQTVAGAVTESFFMKQFSSMANGR